MWLGLLEDIRAACPRLAAFTGTVHFKWNRLTEERLGPDFHALDFEATSLPFVRRLVSLLPNAGEVTLQSLLPCELSVLSAPGVRAFGSALAGSTVTALHLSHCSFDDTMTRALLAGLGGSTNLRSLDLSRNVIGAVGAASLARFITTHPSIERLSVKLNNRLPEDILIEAVGPFFRLDYSLSQGDYDGRDEEEQEEEEEGEAEGEEGGEDKECKKAKSSVRRTSV